MASTIDLDDTSHPHAQRLRAHYERLAEEADAAGLSRASAAHLIGIDASLFAWRRRLIKGDMARAVLAKLGAGIEHAEFEALTAVSRLTFGIGGPARQDITIGDIADEMSIDPSRASRLVSALVQKKFLRRDVSQADARKTILLLTDASRTLLREFMRLKGHVMFDVFQDWEDKDIAAFERLLARYMAAMDDAVTRIEPADTTQPSASRKPKRGE